MEKQNSEKDYSVEDIQKCVEELKKREEVIQKREKELRQREKKQAKNELSKTFALLVEGFFIAFLVGILVNQATDVITYLKEAHKWGWTIGIIIGIIIILIFIFIYHIYKMLLLIENDD